MTDPTTPPAPLDLDALEAGLAASGNSIGPWYSLPRNDLRAIIAELRSLRAAGEEFERLRNVEDALIFLDAHTVNYLDAEGFLEECRELGWEPGAGAKRISDDGSLPSPPVERT